MSHGLVMSRPVHTASCSTRRSETLKLVPYLSSYTGLAWSKGSQRALSILKARGTRGSIEGPRET